MSYLHFQIQKTATHAVYEELESEATLWDLDEIQTYRGNHLMLQFHGNVLHPPLSSHYHLYPQRQSSACLSYFMGLHVRMSREESFHWVSQ